MSSKFIELPQIAVSISKQSPSCLLPLQEAVQKQQVDLTYTSNYYLYLSFQSMWDFVHIL